MVKLNKNLKKHGKLWKFSMTKHYNCDDETAMNAIADWIEGNKSPFLMEEDSNEEDTVFFLDKEQNCIIAFIHERGISKSLYRILDEESKGNRNSVNVLIWYENKNNIFVRHFGPFGNKKQTFLNKVKKIFEEIYKMGFKKILGSNGFLEKKQHLVAAEYENYKAKLMMLEEKLFTLAGVTLGEKALNGLIAAGFFIEHKSNGYLEPLVKIAVKECWKDVLGKIAVKEGIEAFGKLAAKQSMGAVGKIAAKESVEVVGKVAAKETVEAVGKQGAKSIPIVGLGIGLGFGLWRLIKGEPAKAVLEVASGAASCFPGVGTATSIGNP